MVPLNPTNSRWIPSRQITIAHQRVRFNISSPFLRPFVPYSAPSSVLSETETPDKVDENAPILHLRFHRSFHKIWNPPAPEARPSSSNLPLPNTSSRNNADMGSDGSPFNRFMEIVQRRYAEQEARLQARGGGGGSLPMPGGNNETNQTMPGGMTGR